MSHLHFRFDSLFRPFVCMLPESGKVLDKFVNKERQYRPFENSTNLHENA